MLTHVTRGRIRRCPKGRECFISGCISCWPFLFAVPPNLRLRTRSGCARAPKVDLVAAVRTSGARKSGPSGGCAHFSAARPPLVHTRAPRVCKVGCLGLPAGRKTSAFAHSAGARGPKSGPGARRAHKPLQKPPYRAHKRAICGPGGGVRGTKSGPGGHRAHFRWSQEWTRCPPERRWVPREGALQACGTQARSSRHGTARRSRPLASRDDHNHTRDG